MRMLKTRNHVDTESKNWILPSLLQLSVKAPPALQTKFTDRIQVSDFIQVIEGAVTAGWTTVWMTSVMLQYFMQPTAYLSAETSCTWSGFWKSLMVRDRCSGDGAGYRKVTKLGSICSELVDGSWCRELPDESADTRWAYVIHRSDTMSSGGWETERPRSFWMQMIIHTLMYWLSTITVSIMRPIDEHSVAVSMPLSWASTEHKQFQVLPLRQTQGGTVTFERHRILPFQW